MTRPRFHASGTRARRLVLIALVTLGGCVSVIGNDPTTRTLGTAIDDELIETRAARAIRSADPVLADAHLNVTSFNGRVLLTGQTGTEGARNAATDAARGVREVRDVFNEMTVAGPMSIPARANDSWLTTKVKSALLASDETSGLRIKVVTENGVVYLMGLITRAEAAAATELARSAYGVQKIVSLFEFVD